MARSPKVVEFAREAIQFVVCDYLTEITENLLGASIESGELNDSHGRQLLEWVRYRERLLSGICKITVIRKSLRKADQVDDTLANRILAIENELREVHRELQRLKPNDPELSEKYKLLAAKIKAAADKLEQIEFVSESRTLWSNYKFGIVAGLLAPISTGIFGYTISDTVKNGWTTGLGIWLASGFVILVVAVTCGFEQKRRGADE